MSCHYPTIPPSRFTSMHHHSGILFSLFNVNLTILTIIPPPPGPFSPLLLPFSLSPFFFFIPFGHSARVLISQPVPQEREREYKQGNRETKKERKGVISPRASPSLSGDTLSSRHIRLENVSSSIEKRRDRTISTWNDEPPFITAENSSSKKERHGSVRDLFSYIAGKLSFRNTKAKFL